MCAQIKYPIFQFCDGEICKEVVGDMVCICSCVSGYVLVAKDASVDVYSKE